MNLTNKLSRQELAVIHEKEDWLYFEVIKGMTVGELKQFDIYVPTNLKHYNHRQVEWLKDELYLICVRENHKPTEAELLEDIEFNHNSERFRVYYSLKYPTMVYRSER